MAIKRCTLMGLLNDENACLVQPKAISQMKEDGILVGLATGRGQVCSAFHGQSGFVCSHITVNIF